MSDQRQPSAPARTLRAFALLALLLVALFMADLIYGSVTIPLSGIAAVFSGAENLNPAWKIILLDFRLPKALTAILAGAALSASGLLMQTLFRNPLAGPFVLGISSGASLGVALVVLAGAWFTLLSGPAALILAAIAGAAAMMLVVLLVASRTLDNMTILIVGVMFGAATGAMVSILQYFSTAERIQSFLLWTFGSLGGVTWAQLLWLLPVCLGGLTLTLLLPKPLDALLLGEQYAASLGIPVKKVRLILIAVTALLTGAVTAFCGPIAFVGLAVPHVMRSLLNTAEHRRLMPATVLGGAVLMLGCDLISQLPGREITLPINAITALFGAPVVIWVILKNRNLKGGF